MDFTEQAFDSTSTSIRCTNLPPSLLDKKQAKQYFKQFGRILRITVKPKSRQCTVFYETADEAAIALSDGGNYKGEKFSVALNPVKQKMKKDPDPDWTLDPDVKAELEAMGGIFGEKRKYNLRPEAMMVDPLEANTQPPAKKKERKIKRAAWKEPLKSTIKLPAKPLITVEETELLNSMKQQAFTVDEKYKILDARDKFLRLMRGKKQVDLKAKHTVGTCPDMCPEKERLMREIQHQVALYEQESDRSMNHSLAVKQYSRSSADQESPLPQDLRNVKVLQMTMGYLMHRIMDMCDNHDTNMAEWYHFLWDRTRGIRKDITQQELCCQGSVELVEQCARFHIHCSARLVAEDPSVFDQKINTENLTKCLQTLKYMYHDLALKGEECPCEPEFRAYVILLNLNDGNFMWEVQQLKTEIQRSKEIRFALDIYSALDKNNYVKFFKLVRSTTYLNACILLRYFIQVRTRALTTIVKCYAPRAPHTQFLIQELCKILAFEGVVSTIDFLEFFGLRINNTQTHVEFDKRMFTLPNYPYALDRAVNIIESKRVGSVGEVVCGHELPEPIFEMHDVQNSFTDDGYLILSEYTKDDEVVEVQDVKKVVKEDPDSQPYWLSKPDPTPKTYQNIFGGHTTTITTTTVTLPTTTTTAFSNIVFKPMPAPAPPATDTVDSKNIASKLHEVEHNLNELKRQQEAREQALKEREYQRQVEIYKQRLLAEEMKRKREEERRRQEEEQRRQLLLQQKLRREQLEAQKRKVKADVKHLMNDLLNRVETDYKNERLQYLKTQVLKRKVIFKWKQKIMTYKRKRKAIDQTPIWISSKTPKETADELYSATQNSTLNLTKRYRSGIASTINTNVINEILKIDLLNLTASKLMQTETKTKQIFWKVNYYVIDLKSAPLIEALLDEHLEMNDTNDYILQRHKYMANTITYCIKKHTKLDLNIVDIADAYIFITNSLNDALINKISSIVRNEAAVSLILNDSNKPDETKIDCLLTEACLDDVHVMNKPLTRTNIIEHFDESLTHLAKFRKTAPPLELNTLKSYLLENLGNILWSRINSFAKWNMAYKQCLTSPNTVIKLFNEGLTKLNDIAFNDESFDYAEFPLVFKDSLNKIPDFLPCDYKYFPVFWKEETYIKQVRNMLKKLYLPKFNYKYDNQDELEQALFHYCKKLFKTNPQKPFYKTMGAILQSYDPNNPQNLIWTNPIETIATHLINSFEYTLPKKYASKTVFNQLITIYETKQLHNFSTEAWFYVKNTNIQDNLDVSLEVIEQEDDSGDEFFDVDKTFDEVFEVKRNKVDDEQRDKLTDLKFYMDDLEKSIELQRKCGLKFESFLESALKN